MISQAVRKTVRPCAAWSPKNVAAPSASVSAAPVAKTGVETSALDPTTSPCEDFYQYACGGWIKATEIPGDEPSWYRSFSVIHDPVLSAVGRSWIVSAWIARSARKLRDPIARNPL